MVDPTDKDTNHIMDQNTGTEGYLKEKMQGKPTWCGEQKRPTKQR